ncbi:hypothetical protein KC333_g115 [Hortaea werneckii]|nr:hypothetical protein KC333_g115 [Hortaea werneckii]
MSSLSSQRGGRKKRWIIEVTDPMSVFAAASVGSAEAFCGGKGDTGAERWARRTERKMGRAAATLPVRAWWIARFVVACRRLGVASFAASGLRTLDWLSTMSSVFIVVGRPPLAISTPQRYISSAAPAAPLNSSQLAYAMAASSFCLVVKPSEVSTRIHVWRNWARVRVGRAYDNFSREDHVAPLHGHDLAEISNPPLPTSGISSPSPSSPNAPIPLPSFSASSKLLRIFRHALPTAAQSTYPPPPPCSPARRWARTTRRCHRVLNDHSSGVGCRRSSISILRDSVLSSRARCGLGPRRVPCEVRKGDGWERRADEVHWMADEAAAASWHTAELGDDAYCEEQYAQMMYVRTAVSTLGVTSSLGTTHGDYFTEDPLLMLRRSKGFIMKAENEALYKVMGAEMINHHYCPSSTGAGDCFFSGRAFVGNLFPAATLFSTFPKLSTCGICVIWKWFPVMYPKLYSAPGSNFSQCSVFKSGRGSSRNRVTFTFMSTWRPDSVASDGRSQQR